MPSMITTRSKTYQIDKSKCLFCNCIGKTNDIKLINVSSPKIQDTIVDIARALENHGPPKQSLPSWSGFHAVLSYKFEEPSPMTTTGYNPVVRGIPTDANTIYTGLKVTEGQMKQLGQNIPVITFDLQLYVIAQNLGFKNWDELGHFVIRLGGFHILEMLWKILGKRYGDAGLMDLFIELKVFAPIVRWIKFNFE